jgi:hypothetical protein
VVERANVIGEELFSKIGCTAWHATLLLTANNNPVLPGRPGRIYFEPDPYNPNTGPNTPNLQLGPTNDPISALTLDLTSDRLPTPRLAPNPQAMVKVPAYIDLKLHDISATSDPASEPECEPLDQNQPAGSAGFFAGNCKFITRKPWGFYNQAARSCITGSSPRYEKPSKRTTERLLHNERGSTLCLQISRTMSSNS